MFTVNGFLVICSCVLLLPRIVIGYDDSCAEEMRYYFLTLDEEINKLESLNNRLKTLSVNSDTVATINKLIQKEKKNNIKTLQQYSDVTKFIDDEFKFYFETLGIPKDIHKFQKLSQTVSEARFKLESMKVSPDDIENLNTEVIRDSLDKLHHEWHINQYKLGTYAEKFLDFRDRVRNQCNGLTVEKLTERLEDLTKKITRIEADSLNI